VFTCIVSDSVTKRSARISSDKLLKEYKYMYFLFAVQTRECRLIVKIPRLHAISKHKR
jgi:hypothetical protein